MNGLSTWREVRAGADYQKFLVSPYGVAEVGERLRAKLLAVKLPVDLAGKSVLDVGSDFGFWCFACADRGAASVLGLDRGRAVRGQGFVDLTAMNRETVADIPRYGTCRFETQEIGREWREHGEHDLVLCMSMYHHAYALCEDHAPLWLWLSRHCKPGGQLLWEGPLDVSDPVARQDMPARLHRGYTEAAILAAAERYFTLEARAAALHEPTRTVLRFRRAEPMKRAWTGRVGPGAGGATRAFEHAGGRRMDEIKRALGTRPYPGTLNLRGDGPFPYSTAGYYRARVLDVVARGRGLEVPWVARWCRLYPVSVGLARAWIMRLEGDEYPESFVELIAPVRMRDLLELSDGDTVEVET